MHNCMYCNTQASEIVLFFSLSFARLVIYSLTHAHESHATSRPCLSLLCWKIVYRSGSRFAAEACDASRVRSDCIPLGICWPAGRTEPVPRRPRDSALWHLSEGQKHSAHTQTKTDTHAHTNIFSLFGGFHTYNRVYIRVFFKNYLWDQ